MDKIKNINILTETGYVTNGCLWMEAGKIVHIGPEDGTDAASVYDGQGGMLVPGFIDLHVHGGAGSDFMDRDVEGIKAICRFHAKHGTTGLLATTMTAPIEVTEETIRFYRQPLQTDGSAILGMHLEGPFINKAYKGAQNDAWIEPPTVENMQRVLDAAGGGLVKMMTLAPELVDDDQVFTLLQEREIIISVGHSDLDYQGGCRCMKRGLSHATHLGNAMRGFHHRNVGVIGLVMEQREMTFDLIADGIHVAPELIRLLTRICSLDQLMLITDAMRAAGLADGRYELGGQEVTVHGKEARLANGSLAGSLLTLDVALQNVMRFTGLPLEQVIPLLTSNPARKLGLADRKGTIAVGKDADLVLLDKNLEVQATWVEGKRIGLEEKHS
ncbi:N-acetylglucosamine-6-phosphate deacetylase [Brevibacillus sp. B_LB10_24]|uniref:N-acetylglucosamine-6-phosphate deacetylase n=1 Tax=Brevibacillus sp. B_LB10_24 TaxID=3380645 RepID=UPI0038B816B0